MWKTVSARIRGSESDLTNMGEDTDGLVKSTSKLQAKVKALTGGFDIMQDKNNYKDIYDIIVGIGERWQDMSDINRASLLETLAGKNQSNSLAAALNNIDVIKEAYKTAEESQGSAEREQARYEQSIQYSIDKVKGSAQELAATFASSDFLKGLVDGANSALEVITALVDKLGMIGTVGAGLAASKFFKNFD